jgi:peptidyl-dipeptidase Dcp
MTPTPSFNPLLETSRLPYQLPPFDQISPAHCAEALAAGMRLHRLEADGIASHAGAPSFENTLVALERSGQLLDRASRVFWNLQKANGSDAFDAIAAEYSPLLAAHRDAIMHDERLFARIDALYSQRDALELSALDRALLERIHLDFVRAGARLSAPQKAQLAAYNGELAALSARFGQNVRKDSARLAPWTEVCAELEGLTDAELEAARASSLERRAREGYLLPLLSPTQQPQLARMHRRPARRRLLAAALARGMSGGEFDNRPLIARIASLRAERAKLLGYRHHADYVLSDSMAGSALRVNQFLRELAPRAIAGAKREAESLQSLIDQSGTAFPLEAHDWAYYAEAERLRRHAFDEAELRPYLEMATVLRDGVFFAAQRLYGLRFQVRTDLPVYHPDVGVYEVFDADDRPLALFLTDFYARPNKSGGAWASVYVPQSGLLGTLPVVANHLNVPKPAPGMPTLLTPTEVVTMFHEFGHGLHAILSNLRYPRLSGMNVARDFVEFPSQVNEIWAFWPEVLKNYARHVETGAVIPDALVKKILASRDFMQGMLTTEYLGAALLDLAWHELEGPIETDAVEAFEKNALEEAGIAMDAVPPRYRSGYFRHIFDGGYAAGYYAYLWSEVLDADAEDWFAENGGLNRANGQWLREQVLAQGGGAGADLLFRRFRGRDPEPLAMLKRRGLAPLTPS